jgi:hypothetical protein
LGDRLSDAVSVCIRNLKDIQLGILLCRVYDGTPFLRERDNMIDLSSIGDDSPLLKTILNDDLISAAAEQNDPWLANVGYTLLKDYDKALSCLVVSGNI